MQACEVRDWQREDEKEVELFLFTQSYWTTEICSGRRRLSCGN